MDHAPSEKNLSRRERERLMRRRAMLEAAQAVFAEKGYARATLDEIAERAEFGKGTLYNYFEGGKEDILFAVFEQIYDEVCEVIRSVFTAEPRADRTLRDAFHEFIQTYFDFFLEREDLFMILVKETHRLAFSEEAERSDFFHEQQERMVSTLTPVLEQAMEREEIRDLPPDAVAHLLIANVNGMIVHRCMADRHDNCEQDNTILDRPEHAADFLTTILFDGLSLRPSADAPVATLDTTDSAE